MQENIHQQGKRPNALEASCKWEMQRVRGLSWRFRQNEFHNHNMMSIK